MQAAFLGEAISLALATVWIALQESISLQNRESAEQAFAVRPTLIALVDVVEGR